MYMLEMETGRVASTGKQAENDTVYDLTGISQELNAVKGNKRYTAFFFFFIPGIYVGNRKQNRRMSDSCRRWHGVVNPVNLLAEINGGILKWNDGKEGNFKSK